MKRFFPAVLTAIAMMCGIICGGTNAVMADNGSVNIIVNGSPLQTDQGAEIYDDRTFLPVRAVAEAMNAKVYWDEESRCVMIGTSEQTLLMFIDNDSMISSKDGNKMTYKTLDAPPRIVNERTLVPIRSIAEAFGWNVEWDGSTRTVSISDGSAGSVGVSQSNAQGKTLVAEPLADMNGKGTDKSSTKLQSFEHYCGGRFELDGGITNFTGSMADKEIVDEYIDMLCSDMNLKLVDTYDFEYKGEGSFSYGLDYTGTGRVTESREMQFKDDVECDVCVWGLFERDKLKLRIGLPDSMELVDLGYRYGGKNEDINPAGASASAGLYKLSDGSFATTDGRLTAQLGEAMIIRDGETIFSDAEYTVEKDKKEYLDISSFYRSESICFQVSYNKNMTGDLYTIEDLRRDYNSGKPSNYTYALAFAVNRDDEWTYPLYKNSDYKDLTVRVMYYEKNVEAVFYIYAEFTSSPYEIEALCAVDLSNAEIDPSAPQEQTMYMNDTLNITCPVVYDTRWELFSWKIIEGDSVISLTGDIAQTCTITAKQPGRAVVEVTYSYGVKEPDVLTGIPRSVEKSQTHRYAVNVLN